MKESLFLLKDLLELWKIDNLVPVPVDLSKLSGVKSDVKKLFMIN